jgi:predicted HD superfamily hydrolase involved in NAD metabolism
MVSCNFTGDIKADVKSILYSHNKAKTYDHVRNIAEMNVKIATQYGLDETICELCGYLHDISAIIPPQDMMSYAITNNWYIDESERKYPMLLHQRISRVIAQEDFKITDERILSAIGHHTTLKANPSAYDMAVFVADKLAWDLTETHGQAPFYTVVNDALKHSLKIASLAYMDYMEQNDMILHPHKWWVEAAQWLRRYKNLNKS